MLTIPMNYTALGGTYEVLTGAAKGTQVFGQDPLWLAWVTDLVNLKGSNADQYQHLLTTVTPARFKVWTNDRFIWYLDGCHRCYLPQC